MRGENTARIFSTASTRRAIGCALAVTLTGLGLVNVSAQRGQAGPPPSPQAAAPFDLTGYWVSIVTQDWRWRMVTPRKGDYVGIPINAEAKKVADAWDPAKDEAAGEQCKSYGAPALMSVPGRLHITWQDDRTLKVETDAGQQTRMLQFGARTDGPPLPRSWQGVSVADWQMSRPNVPLILRPAQRTAADQPPLPRYGSLRVVTNNLRPGYLRKNGIPYSANAVLTEYWDVFTPAGGDTLLTVTTEIVDLQYLRDSRLVAIPFKKEPNGAKWDPTPCSSRW